MSTIQVVGAAVREGNKILAAQRSSLMSLPLKWEFVGGKIEDGETHHEALKRELIEELGIDVEVGEFLAKGCSILTGRKLVLYVYEAKIKEGYPVAKEHSQIKWIEIEKMLQLDWAEADIPACVELMKKYGNN